MRLFNERNGRPTNIRDVERLSQHPSARCLRIRIAAIQEAITQYNNTAIIRWLCLWLDQHSKLMLALESGTAPPDAADDYGRSTFTWYILYSIKCNVPYTIQIWIH